MSLCERIFNKSCLSIYNFITTDDLTTFQYPKSILEEVRVANNDVELTNKAETSKALHDIDE